MPTDEAEGSDLTFLNRDHIIAVVVHEGEIVVTTTAGEKITFSVSRATLDRFVDELANNVESNFVSVAAQLSKDDRKIDQGVN
jgi:hypothetical protein